MLRVCAVCEKDERRGILCHGQTDGCRFENQNLMVSEPAAVKESTPPAPTTPTATTGIGTTAATTTDSIQCTRATATATATAAAV